MDFIASALIPWNLHQLAPERPLNEERKYFSRYLYWYFLQDYYCNVWDIFFHMQLDIS